VNADPRNDWLRWRPPSQAWTPARSCASPTSLHHRIADIVQHIGFRVLSIKHFPRLNEWHLRFIRLPDGPRSASWTAKRVWHSLRAHNIEANANSVRVKSDGTLVFCRFILEPPRDPYETDHHAVDQANTPALPTGSLNAVGLDRQYRPPGRHKRCTGCCGTGSMSSDHPAGRRHRRRHRQQALGCKWRERIQHKLH